MWVFFAFWQIRQALLGVWAQSRINRLVMCPHLAVWRLNCKSASTTGNLLLPLRLAGLKLEIWTSHTNGFHNRDQCHWTKGRWPCEYVFTSKSGLISRKYSLNKHILCLFDEKREALRSKLDVIIIIVLL